MTFQTAMRVTVALGGLGLAACSDSSSPSPAVATGLERPGNRIRNLYDAFGKEDAGATFDFGFSALIDYNGQTILFDSGTNADTFRRNVEAFGADLGQVDLAIASHNHADHISGFDHLLEVNPRVKLYLPHDFFGFGAPLELPIGGADPEVVSGLPPELLYFNGKGAGVVTLNSSGRFWKADADYVPEHRPIADGVTLIVTRSPYLGTFSRYPDPSDPRSSEPKLTGLPELSLALDTPDGHVLIVGCSHSSVDGIIRAAKDHLGGEVALVMGGYHLLPYSTDQLAVLGGRLKDELGVKRIAPSHCTGPLAIQVLRQAYGENFIPAGLGAEIPF
ncbi:MAG: MBL fold metallo-hydrolase [bacterium]|nr:MBL fold metallo-hydrolase [bacterium]